MKNYKMVLAYDGTRYNGWQKQGNTENTIQEKLERILQEISAARGYRGAFRRGNASSFPQQTQCKGEALFLFHLDWQAFACV